MISCAANRPVRLTLHVCSAVVALSLGGCAQQGQPGGGPLDTTPPRVTATSPSSGEVLVDPATAITIEFTEPVDQATLPPNLFVSPPREGLPRFDWSHGGRRVRISWRDSLLSELTYRITLGAKIKDRRNNAFDGAYTFAFSTGEQIDRGRISGQVRALDRLSETIRTFDVYAYDLEETPDTFYVAAPAYLTQTGKKEGEDVGGWFDLPYLRPGRFRVLVVADQNRNRRLDPGESYGLPRRDVEIIAGRKSDTLAVFAQVYDTAAFCLATCAGSVPAGLTLTFSEPIDTSRWREGRFTVTSTRTGDTIPVVPLAPAVRRRASMILLSREFNAGEEYEVGVTHLRDTRGVPLCPGAFCTVAVGDDADTTGPRVDWIYLPGEGRGLSSRDPVIIQFTEPVDTISFGEGLAITDTLGVSADGKIVWPDVRTLIFRPVGEWVAETPLNVLLDSARLMDPVGNPAPKQLFSWDFMPLSAEHMGAIEGRVAVADSAWKSAVFHLELRQVRGDLKLEREFSTTDKIAFDLPAGRWILGGYLDLDGDGRYSPGTLYPFSPPEPRTAMDDTLIVRPRFTLEDVIIEF